MGTMFAFLLYDPVRKSEQKHAQRRRDSRAREVASRVASNAARPHFYLWLRPFTSPGHVRIAPRSAMVKRVSPNITTYDYPGFGRTTQMRRDMLWGDLESLFAAMLERRAPILALGRAGEEIGAGRVPESEESWRTTFDTLAEAALAILLLPSTHSGTHWEMQRIMAAPDLLHKSVFVVSPGATWLGAAGLGSTFAPGASGPHDAEPTVRDDALDALGQVVPPRQLEELFGVDEGA